MFEKLTSAKRFAPISVVAYFLLVCLGPAVADKASFSKDVLPVLSDRCFHCHGPDEQNREPDLHATALHALGVHHEKFTNRF